MKVSFIIPVYKVEPYLAECVESILAQTYKDFEIILVDDGSPDSCPALCDAWAQNNINIKAYHKENGGLSDARNYGVERASGEYVIFIDSDDKWLESDSLEKLVSIANEDNYDFIQFNCCYWYKNGSLNKWTSYSSKLEETTNSSCIIIELIKSGTFPMSAWMKMIKRDFLLHNSLTFEKGIINEDVPWMINLLDKSNKARFVNLYIYAYRQNIIGSITNSFSKKKYLDIFFNMEREIKLLPNRSFSLKAKEALKSFIAYQYCILLGSLHNFDRKTKVDLYNKLKPYKSILLYTFNPKVKLANIVYKIGGLAITELVMRCYLKYRKYKMNKQ